MRGTRSRKLVQAENAEDRLAKCPCARPGLFEIRHLGLRASCGDQDRNRKPANTHRKGKMRYSPRSWLSISCLAFFLSFLPVLPKPVFGQATQVVLIFG